MENTEQNQDRVGFTFRRKRRSETPGAVTNPFQEYEQQIQQDAEAAEEAARVRKKSVWMAPENGLEKILEEMFGRKGWTESPRLWHEAKNLQWQRPDENTLLLKISMPDTNREHVVEINRGEDGKAEFVGLSDSAQWPDRNEGDYSSNLAQEMAIDLARRAKSLGMKRVIIAAQNNDQIKALRAAARNMGLEIVQRPSPQLKPATVEVSQRNNSKVQEQQGSKSASAEPAKKKKSELSKKLKDKFPSRWSKSRLAAGIAGTAALAGLGAHVFFQHPEKMRSVAEQLNQPHFYSDGTPLFASPQEWGRHMESSYIGQAKIAARDGDGEDLKFYLDQGVAPHANLLKFAIGGIIIDLVKGDKPVQDDVFQIIAERMAQNGVSVNAEDASYLTEEIDESLKLALQGGDGEAGYFAIVWRKAETMDHMHTQLKNAGVIEDEASQILTQKVTQVRTAFDQLEELAKTSPPDKKLLDSIKKAMANHTKYKQRHLSFVRDSTVDQKKENQYRSEIPSSPKPGV